MARGIATSGCSIAQDKVEHFSQIFPDLGAVRGSKFTNSNCQLGIQNGNLGSPDDATMGEAGPT